jgi:hypothetical protein
MILTRPTISSSGGASMTFEQLTKLQGEMSELVAASSTNRSHFVRAVAHRE